MTTPSHDDTYYAFFCGADMDPRAIRARDGFATARFVAIGATGAAPDVMPHALGDGDIWGIVIRASEHASLADTPRVSVTLRDGATVHAALLTTPDTAGSAAEILAQARYWELPAPYRNRLEALG
jgi:hypothetical protein